MKTKLIIILLIFSFLNLFAKENARIVSLSPNLTEIIFQLGRGDCLVGRSSGSNYFKKAKKVPVVGDFGVPSIEQLLLSKPDMVVATALKDPSIKNSVKKLGIKFYLLPTDSIESYYRAVRILGKLLNAKDNANREISRVKNGLKKFAANIKKIPKKQRPKVFWEISPSPVMTIGNKSFLNDFIHYAGGKNITSCINKDYFSVSKEWVIEKAPDIIISPSMKCQKIKETEKQLGWKTTPAAKNHRIYGNIDQNLVYILAPRILKAIQSIHNIISIMP